MKFARTKEIIRKFPIKELPYFPCINDCEEKKMTWEKYINLLIKASDVSTIELSIDDLIVVKNHEYLSSIESKI